MKSQIFKKIFTAIGLLLLIFVAINMNACSKDKGSNNNNYAYPPGSYGYGYNNYGGGNLGQYVGVSLDRSKEISMTVGSNGSQAWLNGELIIHSYSMNCSLMPGRYPIETQQPGQYLQYAGTIFGAQGIMRSHGYQVRLDYVRLSNQIDYRTSQRMMDININVPGCPINFVAM